MPDIPIPEVQNQHQALISWKKSLKLAALVWLLSRILIFIAMLGIAPLLPDPPGGIQAEFSWGVFYAWDSVHYEAVATRGYEFQNDAQGYNIAFFPLFPLLIRGLMFFGLSFNVAGFLLSNLAFLAALAVLHHWVKSDLGNKVAWWSIVALAWCPFSLFGTVIYTEGLFLCFTVAALSSFDKGQYGWSSLWGSLATATRLPGIALIPSFCFIAWKQKRGFKAFIASIISSVGVLGFSLYCWLQFNEPFAFILTQQGWNREQDFPGQLWLKMLLQVILGTKNWHTLTLVDLWHPLIFILICCFFYALWKLRARQIIFVDIGFYILALILWLLVGDPLINFLMVFGGCVLLFFTRKRLNKLILVYGLLSFLIIFATGRTTSVERFAYGIISLAPALGIIFERYSRHAYATIAFFSILTITFAIRFAQDLWVA